MVQIIAEERKPRFSDQLMQGLSNFSQTASQVIPEFLQQKKETKAMISFADKIEKNNPGSPIHKTLADLYRSPLPIEKKSEIAKHLIGIDPFKMDQQSRLKRDEVRKSYNQRIKEEQDKRKNLWKSEEVQKADEMITYLQQERDALLGFAAEEDDIEEELQERVKFNPANPEHLAKWKQLDKKYKGDKAKVNKKLAKEFSL